eukprot:GHVS01082009.1.p1 GENE.GHVS01082009.1~~GHVS01082009.1.p1  ORF type:complete len:519 (+),score=77.23 GHVS01082009.1:616-2172(+)
MSVSSSQSQSLSLSFPQLPYHYGSPMLAAVAHHPGCPSLPQVSVTELPNLREEDSVGTSLGCHERSNVASCARQGIARTAAVGGGNRGGLAVTRPEEGSPEWWKNMEGGGRLSTPSNTSGCSSGSPTCRFWSCGPTTPATTSGDSVYLRTPRDSPTSPSRSPSTSRTPGAPPPLRAATVTPTTSKSTTSAPPLASPLTPSTDGSRSSVSSWRGVPPTSSAPAKESCRPVAPELKDSAKMLYKTTMCPWHSRGRCFAGDRCNYAHNEHERRLKPDLRETRLCQTFMRKGKCDIKDCSFAHGYERLRTTVGTEETPCAGKGGRERVGEKDGSWSSKCVRPSESLSCRSATTGAGSPLNGPTACLCVGRGSGGGGGGRDGTAAVDPSFFGLNQGADRREATHSRAPDCPDSLVWDQWLSSIARKDGVHTAAKQMETVHQRQQEQESAEVAKQSAERRTAAQRETTNARGDKGEKVGQKQSCDVSSHETAGGLISGVPRYIAFFKFFTFDDLQKASPTVYYD